jgi:hypothetical protein
MHEKGIIMNWRILLAVMAAFFVCTFASTQAQAQATRTWVSGVGDDVNPCSRTAPCKTFAGAISKTAAGGEINCLDPAGFGAVTTTKSITIDCTGTLGGILASSTFGVTVNGAGAIVTLRGLEINGGPPTLPGTFGVRMLQGTRLNIEDCTIYNFAAATPNGHGIVVNNTTGLVRVFVTNTVIRNNGAAASGSGIRIAPTGSASAQVILNNTHITGNFRGIEVVTTGTTAGNNITINNSTIDFNNGDAINVTTNANTATLMLHGVLIANNLNGVITSGAGSVTRIGLSTITQSGSAISGAAGSTFFSYKNNQINGNAADNTPITDAVLQ